MAVVAEFSANVLNGLNPLLVQFTDLSTGAPDTWLWSFGDTSDFIFLDTLATIFKDTVDTVWKDYTFETTSTVQNPLITYVNIGVFSVTLIASLGGDEDTETKLNYVIVVSNILPRPTQLYSGVKEAYPADGWENDKHFLLEQSSPHPCVVQYFDLFVDTTNE